VKCAAENAQTSWLKMRSHNCILCAVIYHTFPLWPVYISVKYCCKAPGHLSLPSLYPLKNTGINFIPLLPSLCNSNILSFIACVSTENMYTICHCPAKRGLEFILGPWGGLSCGCFGDRRHWPWFASSVVQFVNWMSVTPVN